MSQSSSLPGDAADGGPLRALFMRRGRLRSFRGAVDEAMSASLPAASAASAAEEEDRLPFPRPCLCIDLAFAAAAFCWRCTGNLYALWLRVRRRMCRGNDRPDAGASGSPQRVASAEMASMSPARAWCARGRWRVRS